MLRRGYSAYSYSNVSPKLIIRGAVTKAVSSRYHVALNGKLSSLMNKEEKDPFVLILVTNLKRAWKLYEKPPDFSVRIAGLHPNTRMSTS